MIARALRNRMMPARVWPDTHIRSPSSDNVAASVGGLRSLVDDGETGFLVDDRDPAAYAAPVAKLLDNPELAAEIGAIASARSRKYSWSITAARLRRLYGDLVARGLVRCD